VLARKLGKYEIIDWLGGGRFGDVFLARDTLLDTEFALKIARMRKEEISMLQDEAKLLAGLNHVGIVRFYNIDFIDEKFVLVMEYVQGAALREIIPEQGLEIDQAISIGQQIVDAVTYAHSKKVLHRDLKPENIMKQTSRDLAVKITDFGLARFIKTGSLSASTAGTPIYMAPEAWSGDFSDKSDIWSIGAVLYEMLTGVPPFLSDNLTDLQQKIETNKFLLPTMMRPAVPEHLEHIITKCLKSNPDARPTAQEMSTMMDYQGTAIRVTPAVQGIDRGSSILDLTPAQKDILAAVPGKVLLLGQAGCGKTTTLTHAVLKLLDSGVHESRILISTFTNKAANDIKNRLNQHLKSVSHDLWLGTFHTLSMRILRRDAQRLDLSDDFTVMRPADVVSEMKSRPGKHQARAMLQFIGKLKARNIYPGGFKPKTKWEKTCHLFYRQYQDHLKTGNMVDFDDLIMLAVQLLEEHEDVRSFYQNRFSHVFVDELQDINPAQYRLIKVLGNGTVFMTGDEDQSIYGWRGADRTIIRRVGKDFPGIKTFTLTQSFRLPQEILDIANRLMLRTMTAVPTHERGDILVYAAKTENDEANYIINEIKRLTRKQYRYGDIAILYRVNYISRIYEEALVKARIPHTLIGGSSFYERTDIKPLIEYLELIERHAAANRPQQKSTEKVIPLALTLFKIGIQKRDRAATIMTYHLEHRSVLSPARMIGDIVDVVGLRGENIDELMSLARGYAHLGLSDFLNEVRLVQELDLRDWGKNTVKLLTVHSAKGLEFPVVFIVDLLEDVFPLTKKMASGEDIEEERRLCYVALTRAQKKLYLLYPKRRYGRFQQPSRFLLDMFKKDSQ
jgi:DNA helicase-2/ATP-dependent DNA helicase PcrA